MIEKHINFVVTYTLLTIAKVTTYTLMAISLKYILTGSSMYYAAKPILLTFLAVVMKDILNQLCHNLADEDDDTFTIKEISREEMEKMLDESEIVNLDEIKEKLMKELKFDDDEENKSK